MKKNFKPVKKLSAAIDEITSAFDAHSVFILTTLLQTVKLHPSVTVEEVVEVFCEYQDFVNARFQMRSYGETETTLKEHELRCRRFLQILLYGVIEREV